MNLDLDIKCIFFVKDIIKLEQHYLKEIERIQHYIDDIKIKSVERISFVEESLKNNKYEIRGHTYKDGKKKSILLIIRLSDGTQFDLRFSFEKIVDLRKKLIELKQKYKGDWSSFKENI